MSVKIVLAGPRGRMGKEAIKMIQHTKDFILVACIDHKNGEETIKEIKDHAGDTIHIYLDAQTCFEEVQADVFVDLTIPEAGFHHTKTALEYGIRSVVGTSGFSDEQIEELANIAETKETSCIIAPNFALGAVLMMQFAKTAAKFFPDVEIIEKHHDKKLDAPSGTATKTVDLIKEVRENKQQGHPDEYETVEGARGANMDGIHVHSMRLPGLVAHQEVIFGSKSQLLTIKHDSFHRESFMDGLHLAIEEVKNVQGLVYGLENVMDI